MTTESALVQALKEKHRLEVENQRLRDALELIETSVADGRAGLDVWDLSEIATKALKGG